MIYLAIGMILLAVNLILIHRKLSVLRETNIDISNINSRHVIDLLQIKISETNKLLTSNHINTQDEISKIKSSLSKIEFNDESILGVVNLIYSRNKLDELINEKKESKSPTKTGRKKWNHSAATKKASSERMKQIWKEKKRQKRALAHDAEVAIQQLSQLERS